MQISARRVRLPDLTAAQRHAPQFDERPVGALMLAERRRLRGLARPIDPDIAFLAHFGVPQEFLERAGALAARRGTEARQELFAIGFDRSHYWSALAADLRLPFTADLSGAALLDHAAFVTVEAVRFATSALVRIGQDVTLIVGPGPKEIAILRSRLARTPALAARIRIAAPETIRALLVARRHAALSDYATSRLASALPGLSSRGLHLGGEPRGVVLLLAAMLACCLLAPVTSVGAIGLVCSLFFVNCSIWKTAAAFRRARPLRLEAVPTGRLPTYTILVPLYREAGVVPDLIANLTALDYPALCIKRTTAVAFAP